MDPRILIFSIAMGANYLFEVKNNEIWAPAFFKHNDLFIDTVILSSFHSFQPKKAELWKCNYLRMYILSRFFCYIQYLKVLMIKAISTVFDKKKDRRHKKLLDHLFISSKLCKTKTKITYNIHNYLLIWLYSVNHDWKLSFVRYSDEYRQ